MAIYKSGNTALSKKTFQGFQFNGDDIEVMTLQGTVNKTALLLLLCIVPAMVTWVCITSVDPDAWNMCIHVTDLQIENYQTH